MICRVVGEPVLKLNTGILKCQVEYFELFTKILKKIQPCHPYESIDSS